MAEYRFTIPGRLPSLNDYTRLNRGNAGRYMANKKKQALQEEIGWYARKELGKVRIQPPVQIEYRWIEPNKRRDLDNISFAKKFIQDALVDIGLLEDDGWKFISHTSDFWEVDKKNPRVEVKIVEVVK